RDESTRPLRSTMKADQELEHTVAAKERLARRCRFSTAITPPVNVARQKCGELGRVAGREGAREAFRYRLPRLHTAAQAPPTLGQPCLGAMRPEARLRRPTRFRASGTRSRTAVAGRGWKRPGPSFMPPVESIRSNPSRIVGYFRRQPLPMREAMDDRND